MPKKKSRRRVNACPTPHKFPYNKPLDAYNALREILTKDPLHGECRIYRCIPGCKKYHLTSKEK